MSTIKAIEKIAVIGAGIMGHGIAQVCAQGDKHVSLIDVSKEALEEASKKIAESVQLLVNNGLLPSDDKEKILSHIQYTTSLPQGVYDVDIVIEAVPEKLELKEALYKQLGEICGKETIVATNTSGIPINRLAALTKHPEMFIGTHFYMPAHLVPLVEVIQGDKTDEKAVDATVRLMVEIGKQPVRVRKDIPGFIGNRLQHAIAREAMSLVQKGIATPEDIDMVVKTSLAMRMVFTGPLQQRDLNGLDTHMSITEYLYPDLEDAKEPLAILRERVEAGNLGLKTGRGFYDWTQQNPVEVSTRKNQELIDLLRFLADKDLKGGKK